MTKRIRMMEKKFVEKGKNEFSNPYILSTKSHKTSDTSNYEL